MAKDLTSYQAKVGRYQGGDRFYIKAAGYFQFYDQEMTGQQLAHKLAATINVQRIFTASVSTANGVFSVANLPANVGHVYLSMTSNTAAPSFYMTSCVAGQDVWVHIAPGSVASGKVALAASGCSLVYLGEPITSLTLYNSTNSNGAVHLICINDDEWTVVGEISSGGVVAS